MNGPLITVAMPVHNAGRFLLPALRSISRQTFRDFEFLAVDDHSSDGSLDRLRSYARNEPRLRVLENSGKGMSEALNMCIENANGKYLARMDADDISLPERFTNQAEILDTRPDLVVTACAMLCVDPQGWPIRPQPYCTEPGLLLRNLLHECGPGVSHGAAMIRISALRAIGGYRPQYDYCEDIDLWFRLLEQGAIETHGPIGYHYRQHPASNVHEHYAAASKVRARITADTIARRKSLGLPIPEDPQPERQKPSSQPPVGGRARVPNWHALWALEASTAGYRHTAVKHALLSFRGRDSLTSWAWLMLGACTGPEAHLRVKNRYRHLRGLPPVSAGTVHHSPENNTR